MLFFWARIGLVWLAYIGIADNSRHLFLKLKWAVSDPHMAISRTPPLHHLLVHSFWLMHPGHCNSRVVAVIARKSISRLQTPWGLAPGANQSWLYNQWNFILTSWNTIERVTKISATAQPCSQKYKGGNRLITLSIKNCDKHGQKYCPESVPFSGWHDIGKPYRDNR